MGRQVPAAGSRNRAGVLETRPVDARVHSRRTGRSRSPTGATAARLDAYAARQAAGSGVAGPEAPAEVLEGTQVAAKEPPAQVAAPRPDAQRPLREVDDHLLRLAGEPWGLQLKVKQASEPLEQEATALRKVEQAAEKLMAAQEQADRCAGLLRVAEAQFRDAEQAAGSGIGWLKGAGRKKVEQHDLHTAQ